MTITGRASIIKTSTATNVHPERNKLPQQPFVINYLLSSVFLEYSPNNTQNLFVIQSNNKNTSNKSLSRFKIRI